jgi:hypothetical protein
MKQEQARFGRIWKVELDRLREDVAKLPNSGAAPSTPAPIESAKKGTPSEVAAALRIPLSEARLLVRLGKRNGPKPAVD